MSKFPLWLLGWLLLFGQVGTAMAADAGELSEDEKALLQMYGDQEMISIATGGKQPVGKAPAVASVITAEDIKAMGATDLDEVLETVPGLHVATSTTSYNPIYTIRGVYSKAWRRPWTPSTGPVATAGTWI